MIDSDDVDSRLAARLRLEREARGWTLADLAARSGVSRAMASKVERGEASPTAALLGRLATALGLTLAQLFARTEAAGQVLRAYDQPAWRDPETGFLRRALSPPGTAPLDLTWAELPPGAAIAYPAAAFMLIADPQVVVIEGLLTLVSGESAHVLAAGDCLRFGPPLPVEFRNDAAVACRYVVATLRA
jgi:transcriptional regulator with XRE-family HTH domain